MNLKQWLADCKNDLSHNDYWLTRRLDPSISDLYSVGLARTKSYFRILCTELWKHIHSTNNFRQLKLGTYNVLDMVEKGVGIQSETHPLADFTLLSNPRQTTYSILGRKKKNMLSSSFLLIIYSTKLYTIHITIFKITIGYFTNLG